MRLRASPDGGCGSRSALGRTAAAVMGRTVAAGSLRLKASRSRRDGGFEREPGQWGNGAERPRLVHTRVILVSPGTLAAEPSVYFLRSVIFKFRIRISCDAGPGGTAHIIRTVCPASLPKLEAAVWVALLATLSHGRRRPP